MFGRPNAAVLLLLLVVAAALVIPGNAQPTKQLDNAGKGLGKSKICGYCLPNPCKNSGECSIEEDGSGFKCACPSPFAGTFCTAVEMDVAVNRAIWMYDTYGEIPSDSGFRALFYGLISFNSSLVVVNNYLTFLVYGKPNSGFSIRVKGTFLGGDEMLCRQMKSNKEIGNFFDYNVGEWKEPGFVVPEDDTWVNPEQAVVNSPDLFFPGDVEGSTIPAPDDKKFWLLGEYNVICRLKLEDLNLNLPE